MTAGIAETTTKSFVAPFTGLLPHFDIRCLEHKGRSPVNGARETNNRDAFTRRQRRASTAGAESPLKGAPAEAIAPASRGLAGEACGSVAIIRSRPIAGGQAGGAFHAAWCISLNDPESAFIP